MNTPPRVVALYGTSLIMEGIASSLANYPNLVLHPIHEQGQAFMQHLGTLHPEVLIFDLAADLPHEVLALLRDQAQCLLLGIDLQRQEMHHWFGQHTRAFTLQDLVQAIQQDHP
jgi:hypothetical protein